MAGGSDVLGRIEVFERDGNTMKRTLIGTGAKLPFSASSLFERHVGSDRDETVQLSIDGLNSF
jgi:hypothetical protein